MQGFRDWLLVEEEIPKDAIKIALPVVRQETNYTCGPAALKAIAIYFQVGTHREKDYAKLCQATQKNGTPPKNLVHAGKSLGLHVALKEGMTIKELLRYLKRGVPVICNMQAWGSPEGYKDDESGHYIVAVGFDDKKIYFEDPSIDSPDRGYLPYEEFDRRWHDSGRGGNTDHLGIAMWKQTPLPDKKRQNAKKIK